MSSPQQQQVTDARLLLALYDLWIRLGRHSQGDKNTGGMLEKYHYFLENSTFGADCAYAAKCKDLFLRWDYEEVREEFLRCLAEFRLIEGDDFAR